MNRAVEFDRSYSEGLVDEIVRTEHGRVLLTPALPRVYYLNHFLADPGIDASASELVAEIEPIFEAAGLAHRKISVGDELGARLAPELRRLGWKAEELLVMPHTGSDPDVDTSPVEEVGPDELEPLWVEGMRASPEITDEEEIRQLVTAQHRRRRAVDVRYFAARSDGDIGSYCELFSDGRTGQIESVMTLERFRGRGLAKAVVVDALRASRGAGHDLTFLLAEAADWPKELYRKLGFETTGSIWDFLRRGHTVRHEQRRRERRRPHCERVRAMERSQELEELVALAPPRRRSLEVRADPRLDRCPERPDPDGSIPIDEQPLDGRPDAYSSCLRAVPSDCFTVSTPS